MRNDHYSPPSKWFREYRRALRMSHEHLAVYAYLESGPESHATGLYHILPVTIAGMLSMEADVVEKIMDELQEASLLLWDRTECVVYIPCVCDEQFRWTGKTWKKTDNRVVGARKHIKDLPDSWLKTAFLAKYELFSEGASQGASQGAWQGAPTHTYTGEGMSFPHPAAKSPFSTELDSEADLPQDAGSKLAGGQE